MAADPSSPERTSGRGGRLTLWVAAAAVLAFSVLGGHHATNGIPEAPRAAGARAAAPADPHRVGTALPRATPTRLLIPKISVDAPFVPLTLAANGQLQPPPAGDTNLVGWYAKGAAPGEQGTAVIAGHVDTAVSAAVFANLDELKRGDTFSVQRDDGRQADFVVDDAETFAKNDFPSKRVYADTSRAEVRLITCAGDYDHTVRDYTDNLVVFAHLI
ncbi:class F sortase [Streptomyces sp. NPDC001606]